MSRGMGKVQRMCLDVLEKSDKTIDSIEVAGRALGKMQVEISEGRSFRRALQKLAEQGLVIDMGRHWRFGRRHWATREVAEKYFEHVERTFGAQAAKRDRSESSIDRVKQEDKC